MKKFKFIKNPEKKIETLKSEVEVFHKGNRALMGNKKVLNVDVFYIDVQIVAAAIIKGHR